MALSETNTSVSHNDLLSFTKENIQNWQNEFKNNGICILKNFLNESITKELCQEALKLLPTAYHHQTEGNAYLEPLDASLPAGHPKTLTEKTSLKVVACDEIPSSSSLKKLYFDKKLLTFVKSISQTQELYFYNCPLGAINYSIMTKNDSLRWHFDQSDFVVSLVLQNTDVGGHYQYIKDLRSKEEPNYAEVLKALTDKHPRQSQAELTPGSLVLFRGKNTLHRVTQIIGDTPRITALLGFTKIQGSKSDDYLKNLRYGRCEAKNQTP